MNYRKIPPLRALRAFVASAKHLSFTRAAEDLYVTQAAVSLQVKQLEEFLEIPLFIRGSRSLTMTAQGKIYLQDVNVALKELAAATERVTRRNRNVELVVSTLTSFAERWLIPKLPDFQQAHANMDIRITASEWVVDFDRDGVDLAIRYGGGEWPDTNSTLLLRDNIFPVCSPGLCENSKLPCKAENLAQFTLLHDDYAREDWMQWLKVAGITSVDAQRGLSFSHSSMMLEAAAQGMGLALGHTSLIQDDLKSGRLIKPFESCLRDEMAYYIVTPVGTDNKLANVFRDWLLEEARQKPLLKN
ncbi:MAG: transcriptional regulator GcvA [Xanthomonadales bacterium]|nr:transcriptional regulator GcvA [Xanthomonadales bacterium]